MKILWLGNIVLPDIAEQEHLPISYGGGWMLKLAKMVGQEEDNQLVYVFDYEKEISGEIPYGQYYGIPSDIHRVKKPSKTYVNRIQNVLIRTQPDVIHIWGTEYIHSLAMVEACKSIGIVDRVVVSMQGLMSFYAKHYYAYLPHSVVYKSTLKDILTGNVWRLRRAYEKHGIAEKEVLKNVKHVIGRTEWDRACLWNVNPVAEYHLNNEILRDEFYSNEWKYNRCEKYSIFCSQAYSPIKGLHIMLCAMEKIIEVFPQAKLYVGGKNYYQIPKWQQSAYEKYILALIRKKKLKNNVIFLGYLSATEMKERYLKSNVFVSSSSIENSPNSVGEAMLLGVPVISSHVGGVNSMLVDGKEGLLYPADEPYMLAYYVCQLFKDKELAEKISRQARIHAQYTHNVDKNYEELKTIYTNIYGNKNNRFEYLCKDI